jgi:hypothetical protein
MLTALLEKKGRWVKRIQSMGRLRTSGNADFSAFGAPLEFIDTLSLLFGCQMGEYHQHIGGGGYT